MPYRKLPNNPAISAGYRISGRINLVLPDIQPNTSVYPHAVLSEATVWMFHPGFQLNIYLLLFLIRVRDYDRVLIRGWVYDSVLIRGWVYDGVLFIRYRVYDSVLFIQSRVYGGVLFIWGRVYNDVLVCNRVLLKQGKNHVIS